MVNQKNFDGTYYCAKNDVDARIYRKVERHRSLLVNSGIQI